MCIIWEKSTHGNYIIVYNTVIIYVVCMLKFSWNVVIYCKSEVCAFAGYYI